MKQTKHYFDNLLRMSVLMVVLPLLLTGCWDKREIEDSTYAILLGIDGDGGGELLVTVGFPQTQTEEDGGYTLMSVKAPTLAEGLHLFGVKLSGPLALYTVKTVVLSRELAESGDLPRVFASLRHEDIRNTTNVLVSEDAAAEFIKARIQSPLIDPLRQEELLLEQANGSSYTQPIQLLELLSQMQQDGGCGVAMYGGLAVSEEEDSKESGKTNAGGETKAGGGEKESGGKGQSGGGEGQNDGGEGQNDGAAESIPKEGDNGKKDEEESTSNEEDAVADEEKEDAIAKEEDLTDKKEGAARKSTDGDGGGESDGLALQEGYLPGEVPLSADDPCQIMGLAVFRGETMVGVLDSEEAQFFSMMTGGQTQKVLTLPDPLSPDNNIVVTITSAGGRSLRCAIKDGIPVFTMDIRLHCSVEFAQTDIDYNLPEHHRRLRDAIQAHCLESMEALANKAQGEFDADIFRLGDKLRYHFATMDSWENFGWSERYRDAELQLRLDCNVIPRTEAPR